MSLVPGADGEKVVCKDGLQVDHISENTVGHGARPQAITNPTTYPVAAGEIGEYVTVDSAGAVSLTTGQFSDGGCAGYTPAAGVWEVQVHSYTSLSATTVLQAHLVGLGTAAGNSGTGVNSNRGVTKILNPAGGTMTEWFNVSSPVIRITSNGSTTYYAKNITYFTTSTATAANYMTWRRVA